MHFSAQKSSLKTNPQLLGKGSHTKASLTGQDYRPSMVEISSVQEQVNHKRSTALAVSRINDCRGNLIADV